MKRAELILVYKALNNNNNTDNIRFNYGINKNLKIINNEIESLREMEDSINVILNEYRSEQKLIASKYGVETESGIQIEKENVDLFNSEVKTLDEKFKDDITKFNKRNDDYKLFLNEDIEDFEFFKIKEEHLPEKNLADVDGISALSILMKYDIIE